MKWVGLSNEVYNIKIGGPFIDFILDKVLDNANDHNVRSSLDILIFALSRL